MSELGDLTDFLKEGSAISDLDWLDVDAKAYRALDTLPKQNLDIAPDLEALWRHKDEPASNFVPNTGAPKTMGDLSEVHGRLAMMSIPSDLVRTARLAIMQTVDPLKIRSILASRYDGTALQNAKTALSEVFAERGLLGRYYVASQDFPDCNRGSREASDFVRRYASEAKFVIAKTACSDCSHRRVTNGTSHCGVFHKQIQMDIPYSDGLAADVEMAQQAKGMAFQASAGSPRERIQRAFLASTPSAGAQFSGQHQYVPAQAPVNTPQVLIAASNLTKKRDQEDRQKVAAVKARPIIAFLRKEMLKGRTESELAHGLRLAFDLRDLEATKSEWGPLFKEAGLFGAVYLTQGSFDDCREGSDFISRHASKVRAVVAGEKCKGCIYNKVGRCLMYARKLVATATELYTNETVQAIVDEQRIAGKLPQEASRMKWGSTPVEALKNIHNAASMPVASITQQTQRGLIETAFYGSSHQVTAGELTKRNILKKAAEYLNEGLYGPDLLTALRKTFDPRAILATGPELRAVLAEQGLQGFKYIDPSVYDDYGKGCQRAASLHRSRGAVKYAKVGDKCSSCVHQTRIGHCSVLNKQLVVEPPYIDKLAEQRAMLASGPANEMPDAEALMANNGLTMMQEYQLQHREASIDFNPEGQRFDSSIQFGNHEIKL
jgi:hypothetical protein